MARDLATRKRLARRGAIAVLVSFCVAATLLVAPPSASAATPPTGSGSLDASFGTGGIANLPNGFPSMTVVSTVVLQPDGKVLVAGLTPGTTGSVVVARFN